MSGVLLNGSRPDGTLRFRELSPEFQTKVGFKLAVESTKNNGLDEIFIEQDGHKYVLASDTLDLSTLGKNPTIDFNGKPAQILKVSDEDNSQTEHYEAIASNAVSSGLTNGVGGAAAGLVVMLFEKGLKIPKGTLALGALVGFASGFAWGAGSSVAREVKGIPVPDWSSINDLVIEKDQQPANQPAILNF